MADLHGGQPPSVSFWQDIVAWVLAMKSSILPGFAGAVVRGLVATGLTLGQRFATMFIGCLTFIWLGPVTGPAAAFTAERWAPFKVNVDDVDQAARFVTGLVACTVVEAVLKWAGYWKEHPWPPVWPKQK